MIELLPILADVLPPSASNWSPGMSRLFWLVFWVCAVSFVIVEGALIYFAVTYRRKKGEPNKKTPFITHSTKLELIWTIIPTVIVMWIFVEGLLPWIDQHTIPKEEAATVELDHKNVVVIEVTGKQWLWQYKYPGMIDESKGLTRMVKGSTRPRCVNSEAGIKLDGDTLGKQRTKTDCEELGAKWQTALPLIVPKGKKVVIKLSSADVLHSFSIPAFAIKQDVVPNVTTATWFIPTKLGEYEIFCTEYCGIEHSGMLAAVKVLPWNEFIEELKKRQPDDKPVELTATERIALGSGLYQDKGCATCHSSVEGERRTGPSFYGIYGKKEKMADGRVVLVNDAYLTKSMLDPSSDIVATYAPQMPAQELTNEEIKNLIAYIKSLAPAASDKKNKGVKKKG